MSSPSPNQDSDATDGKLATESSPAGMNSITNTVGMQPTTNQTLVPPEPPVVARRGSCDRPGCTADHSGKPHE